MGNLALWMPIRRRVRPGGHRYREGATVMAEPADAALPLRTAVAPAEPEGGDAHVEGSVYDLTFRLRGGSRLVEDPDVDDPEAGPAGSA
jgi:hypothetical protein